MASTWRLSAQLTLGCAVLAALALVPLNHYGSAVRRWAEKAKTLLPASKIIEGPRHLAVAENLLPAIEVWDPDADVLPPEASGVNVEDINAPAPMFRLLTLGGGVLIVPLDLIPTQGTYDLILHFHGTGPSLDRALAQSGTRAVMYAVTLGIGSGPYETAYADEKALDRTVALVETLLARHVPRFVGTHADRIALSAWSAGYGAVYRMLAHEKIVRRIDAVLLADGMHVRYANRFTHRVDPDAMTPFTAFARRATAGEKLMVVTHSAIETSGYATTTETANSLIATLDLTEQKERVAEPASMVRTSRADRGNLHILGFNGTNRHAHCEHFYFLGQTAFPWLHDRWRGPNQ